MIRKSGSRFSEKIMHHWKCMIRKSGSRFSEKIMHRWKFMIRKKPVPDPDRAGAATYTS
jgi:hypothetical protein